MELQEPVIWVRVRGEFELSEFELLGFHCTLRVAFGLLTIIIIKIKIIIIIIIIIFIS